MGRADAVKHSYQLLTFNSHLHISNGTIIRIKCSWVNALVTSVITGIFTVSVSYPGHDVGSPPAFIRLLS